MRSISFFSSFLFVTFFHFLFLVFCCYFVLFCERTRGFSLQMAFVRSIYSMKSIFLVLRYFWWIAIRMIFTKKLMWFWNIFFWKTCSQICKKNMWEICAFTINEKYSHALHLLDRNATKYTFSNHNCISIFTAYFIQHIHLVLFTHFFLLFAISPNIK